MGFLRRLLAAALSMVSASADRISSGEMAAEESLQRAIEAYQRGDHHTAGASFAEAIQLDPKMAQAAPVQALAHVAEGISAFQKGDHRQAIGAWRGAAAIDPKMVPAYLALADGYLRIAEPVLAAQALRAGLQALPDSPELRAKLAQIEKSR